MAPCEKLVPRHGTPDNGHSRKPVRLINKILGSPYQLWVSSNGCQMGALLTLWMAAAQTRVRLRRTA